MGGKRKSTTKWHRECSKTDVAVESKRSGEPILTLLQKQKLKEKVMRRAQKETKINFENGRKSATARKSNSMPEKTMSPSQKSTRMKRKNAKRDERRKKRLERTKTNYLMTMSRKSSGAKENSDEMKLLVTKKRLKDIKHFARKLMPLAKVF